eukprot:8158292-Pyramimonas_sp.AAC.2
MGVAPLHRVQQSDAYYDNIHEYTSIRLAEASLGGVDPDLLVLHHLKPPQSKTSSSKTATAAACKQDLAGMLPCAPRL